MLTTQVENMYKTSEHPDGYQIGRSADSLVGFYGKTPAAQRSGSAQAAVGTAASTKTSPAGFATKTQADAIVTLLNEIRSVLVGVGLMKGSA